MLGEGDLFEMRNLRGLVDWQIGRREHLQKPLTPVGQCASGHDVWVTHDLNDEINGGTIGTKTIAPLPDGQSTKPIVVACDDCLIVINNRIAAKS